MNKFSITLIFILLSLSAWSQNEGDIETVEIKIVKDYNVFIEEATKLNIPIQYQPQFKDKSAQKKIQYKLPDRIEEFKFEPTSIEPMAYKSKEFFYKNTNFLRIGAGSILNPIVEWSHLKLNTTNPYKIYLLHHSAWLASDSFQKYSETKAEMDYTTKIKDWTLIPRLALNHKLYNFYGNLNESNFRDESNRNYGNADLSFVLKNEKSEVKSISILNRGSINIGMDKLNYLGNDKSNSELYGNLQSNLSYKFSENTKINLNAGAQYYTLKFDTFTDKWLLNLMPHVEYKTKSLKLSGGLDIVQALINSKGTLYVLPKLESELQVIPNYLNFYSLWERKIELNTLRSTMNLNPFALYSNALVPNTKVENRSVGIKGNIKDISYHAYFNMKIMKDAILYKNDSTNPRYSLAVIEKNMTQNNVSLELSYMLFQRLSAYIKSDLFLYELDNLPIAYNLPGQRVSFGFNAIASKKLNLSFNTFVIGGVKTMIAGNQVTNPMAFDMNLGGEFLFSKNFYIFANINNILNTKISPQFGYNSYGTNGQAGLRIVY